MSNDNFQFALTHEEGGEDGDEEDEGRGEEWALRIRRAGKYVLKTFSRSRDNTIFNSSSPFFRENRQRRRRRPLYLRERSCHRGNLSIKAF